MDDKIEDLDKNQMATENQNERILRFENITKYDLDLKMQVLKTTTQTRKILSIFSLCLIALLVIFELIAYLSLSKETLILITIYLVVVLVSFILPYVTIKSNHKKSIFKDNDFVTCYEFYDDNMIQRAVKGGVEVSKTNLTYNQIVKAYENKDFILIYCTSNMCFGVAKNQMVNGTGEMLGKFLQQKIKKYKCKR